MYIHKEHVNILPVRFRDLNCRILDFDRALSRQGLLFFPKFLLSTLIPFKNEAVFEPLSELTPCDLLSTNARRQVRVFTERSP